MCTFWARVTLNKATDRQTDVKHDKDLTNVID